MKAYVDFVRKTGKLTATIEDGGDWHCSEKPIEKLLRTVFPASDFASPSNGHSPAVAAASAAAGSLDGAVRIEGKPIMPEEERVY